MAPGLAIKAYRSATDYARETTLLHGWKAKADERKMLRK